MSARVACAVLAAAVAAEAVYASALQAWFYRHAGPFNDSSGYYLFLAHVWRQARTEGVIEAVQTGLGHGRVALPWVEAALLAPVIPLSRQVGVWLQAIWLAALALSVFHYLARHRGFAAGHAVCATLPFVAFRSVFEWNGGLSDFRMDLPLYTMCALAAVWWLITYETRGSAPWLAAGLFAALACLARATAPVYVAVMLGPLIALRLARPDRERRAILTGLAVMAAPVAALAVPYLAAHLDTLTYYYTVRNEDATARLPLRISAGHLGYVAWHLGPALLLFAGVGWLMQMRAGWSKRGSLTAALRGLDWKALWLGFAPAGFLAWHGAGLNPFVSMPSVFGTLLFLLAPFAGRLELTPGKRRAAAALAVAAVAGSAGLGLLLHRAGLKYTASMPAIRGMIETIRADAAQNSGARARIVAASSIYFFHGSISHALLFDEGAAMEAGGLRGRGGVLFSEGAAATFVPVRQFADERMEAVAREAHRHADYFILPDEASYATIEDYAGGEANRKSRLLRAALLAGGWQRLGTGFRVRAGETVEILRRPRQ